MKFKICLLSMLFCCSFSKAQKKDFRIFDAIMIPDKPNLFRDGLSFINMVYQETVVNVNLNRPNEMMLAEDKIMKIKADINEKFPICLNIESWTIDSEYYKASVPKYVNTLRVFKKKFPRTPIAFAGIFPHDAYDLHKVYSVKVEDKSKDWKAYWLSLNRKLTPIAKESDYITLVAYTPNEDRQQWRDILIESVNQARKSAPNKKIYVFLWPQYFNREEAYNEDFFSSELWYYQLEQAYKLTDGIILWMPPYNMRKNGRVELKWNYEDGWWIRTKEFINERFISSNYQ